MDGGYPYTLTGQGLPKPARIIAVADVFQAMAQNRPYRASVPPLRILDLLRDKAREGKLTPRPWNWWASTRMPAGGRPAMGT